MTVHFFVLTGFERYSQARDDITYNFYSCNNQNAAADQLIIKTLDQTYMQNQLRLYHLLNMFTQSFVCF
jgi:hypothetical protein